jgi:hypothetical protein
MQTLHYSWVMQHYGLTELTAIQLCKTDIEDWFMIPMFEFIREDAFTLLAERYLVVNGYYARNLCHIINRYYEKSWDCPYYFTDWITKDNILGLYLVSTRYRLLHLNEFCLVILDALDLVFIVNQKEWSSLDEPSKNGILKRRVNSTPNFTSKTITTMRQGDRNYTTNKRHCVQKSKPVIKQLQIDLDGLEYEADTDIYAPGSPSDFVYIS